MEQQFYAEYSLEQGCPHIDSMDSIIASNRSMMLRGVCNGYMIIGGPFSYKEAAQCCDKFIKQLNQGGEK